MQIGLTDAQGWAQVTILGRNAAWKLNLVAAAEGYMPVNLSAGHDYASPDAQGVLTINPVLMRAGARLTLEKDSIDADQFGGHARLIGVAPVKLVWPEPSKGVTTGFVPRILRRGEMFVAPAGETARIFVQTEDVYVIRPRHSESMYCWVSEGERVWHGWTPQGITLRRAEMFWYKVRLVDSDGKALPGASVTPKLSGTGAVLQAFEVKANGIGEARLAADLKVSFEVKAGEKTYTVPSMELKPRATGDETVVELKAIKETPKRN